jgi:hypothetical protein
MGEARRPKTTAYDLVKAYKELYPDYWIAREEEKRLQREVQQEEESKLDQDIDDLLSRR